MEDRDSLRWNWGKFFVDNFIREQVHLKASNVDENLATYVQEFLDDPPVWQEDTKNHQHSVICIKRGDQYMRRAAYEEAAEAYTLGLQLAYAYSTASALCFSRRSVALQKLKCYDDSLLDAERALQLPLSENLKIDVLRRKEQLAREIKKKQSRNVQQPAETKKHKAETTLSYGESEEVPGASSAIAIAYNKEYGRHFVATRGIKAGDVLLIQQPYIVIMNDLLKKSTTCNHCLRFTRAAIPCDRCVVMVYCSTECRSEAYEKYHKGECCMLTSEYLFPLLRILMTITDQGESLQEIKKYVEEATKSEDPRKAGFTGDQFIGNSTKALLSIPHRDNITATATYNVTHLAVLLKNYTDFLHGSNDVLGLAKLMLRIGCLSEKYLKTIRCTKQEDKDYIKGLYPVFELLNHSCVPNTISYNLEDKRRVLRASRDIKAGEQIFTSYINPKSLAIISASSRKDLLMEVENFSCLCEACTRNYSFTMALKRKMKLPIRLQRRLKKAPINIENMWELLDLLQREIRQPCLEIEVMKFALSRAYMDEESECVRPLYTKLGVF